jgi:hypothetical protein
VTHNGTPFAAVNVITLLAPLEKVAIAAELPVVGITTTPRTRVRPAYTVPEAATDAALTSVFMTGYPWVVGVGAGVVL